MSTGHTTVLKCVKVTALVLIEQISSSAAVTSTSTSTPVTRAIKCSEKLEQSLLVQGTIKFTNK